jgi:replicative DNA helicase
MGKTAKMLTEARMAAKSGVPVGIFSLEMTRAELSKRMICQEGEISNAKMKWPAEYINFAANEHEYIEQMDKYIAGLPIFIDDRSRTMREIKAKARTWCRSKGVKIIYLENLGLIKLDGGNKNKADAIGDATSDLKALAKELDIPIIVVVQLNRSTETKGGAKRPSLHELRDSGRIEEDADWVAFVYRPEYYGIESDEFGNSTNGVAEIIYAKHRDGELDTIKCEFIGDCFIFRDVEPKPFTPYKHVEQPVKNTGDFGAQSPDDPF